MAGCDSGLPGSSTVINPTCDADTLTPAEFFNCIVNNQQQFASDMSNRAIGVSSSAICSAQGLDLSTARNENPYEVTAEEPEIPDDIANAISTYENLQNTMLPLFGKTYDDWWDQNRVILYNPAYQAAAAWMADVISNGVTGIPAALERQIVNRATARARAEAAMARSNSEDRASSLNWDMPQPFAIAQGEAKELAAYRAIGDATVAIADRQLTIQIDSVKFAVEEANKIYLGMERAAIDYLGAWTSMLSHISDLSQMDPNVQANYTNAVANLYGKRIQKDQVQWVALNDFQQRLYADNQLRTGNSLSQTGLVVDANKAAAEVSKMLGAAALSQLSTMVTSVATS